MSQQLKPMVKQQHLDMFKDWMDGMKQHEIAVKYKMSRDNVVRISRLYQWGKRREMVTEQRYKKMFNRLKQETVKVMEILSLDASKMAKQEDLTLDEKKYLLSYFDRLLKEARLEDGKPTGESPTIVANQTVKIQVSPEMAPAFGMFSKHSKAEIEVLAEEVKDVAADDDDLG